MQLHCFRIIMPPRKVEEHDDIGWQHRQPLEGYPYGTKYNYYGMEIQNNIYLMWPFMWSVAGLVLQKLRIQYRKIFKLNSEL